MAYNAIFLKRVPDIEFFCSLLLQGASSVSFVPRPLDSLGSPGGDYQISSRR